MKTFFLSTTIAILMAVGSAATASAQYQNQVSPNVKLPDHPRLLMLKGEESELLANVQNDKMWSRVQTMLEIEAVKLVDSEPEKRVLKGRRLLSVSREYLRRLFILSYVYRTTGNTEVLDHLKKEVMAACSFSDWNPSHFLDVAEMTMGVAIAYDWAYDKFSKRELRTIRDAIIEKGLNQSFIEEYEKGFNRNYNNWNPVCHAGMVYGALAVWEDDRNLAARVLNRAIANVPVAMKEYAPDGVYPEGAMYWEYGTDFTVMLIEALQRALGTDYGLSQSPGFMRSGAYHLHMFTPSLKAFNYSDNGQTAAVDPVKFWFFKHTNDTSVLYNDLKLLRQRGPTPLRGNRLAPTILLWGATVPTSQSVVPAQLMWTGGGTNPVAAMRTSWTDPKALYLGVKLGKAAISHGHMDAGSFIIESQGVMWAADLGIENYNTLEAKKVGVWNFSQSSGRWDVYRYNANNHNVVTFDHAKHVVTGTATILDQGNDPMNMWVMADLKPVYGTQVGAYVRTYSLKDLNEVVITDNITTDAGTSMSWNLMTAAKVTKINDKELLLEKSGKAMQIKIDFDGRMNCVIEDAKPATDYENKNMGFTAVRFESKLNRNRNYKITVTFTPVKVSKNNTGRN